MISTKNTRVILHAALLLSCTGFIFAAESEEQSSTKALTGTELYNNSDYRAAAIKLKEEFEATKKTRNNRTPEYYKMQAQLGASQIAVSVEEGDGQKPAFSPFTSWEKGSVEPTNEKLKEAYRNWADGCYNRGIRTVTEKGTLELQPLENRVHDNDSPKQGPVVVYGSHGVGDLVGLGLPAAIDLASKGAKVKLCTHMRFLKALLDCNTKGLEIITNNDEIPSDAQEMYWFKALQYSPPMCNRFNHERLLSAPVDVINECTEKIKNCFAVIFAYAAAQGGVLPCGRKIGNEGEEFATRDLTDLAMLLGQFAGINKKLHKAQKDPLKFFCVQGPGGEEKIMTIWEKVKKSDGYTPDIEYVKDRKAFIHTIAVAQAVEKNNNRGLMFSPDTGTPQVVARATTKLPIFMLLREKADQRWGKHCNGDTQATPYYHNGFKVVRQEKDGDWTGPYNTLVKEVETRAMQ